MFRKKHFGFNAPNKQTIWTCRRFPFRFIKFFFVAIMLTNGKLNIVNDVFCLYQFTLSLNINLKEEKKIIFCATKTGAFECGIKKKNFWRQNLYPLQCPIQQVAILLLFISFVHFLILETDSIIIMGRV